MYLLIAGGGLIGANLARSLLRAGHEVTLVEQRRDRFEKLQDELEHVVVRILDPNRAEFYAAQGMRTFCPTSTAITALTEAVRSCEIPQPA
jgi:Trk K+ transport system NAD-binding subunit